MLAEERFLFFPDPVLIGDPSHYGLQWEDAFITASDGIK